MKIEVGPDVEFVTLALAVDGAIATVEVPVGWTRRELVSKLSRSPRDGGRLTFACPASVVPRKRSDGTP